MRGRKFRRQPRGSDFRQVAWEQAPTLSVSIRVGFLWENQPAQVQVQARARARTTECQRGVWKSNRVPDTGNSQTTENTNLRLQLFERESLFRSASRRACGGDLNMRCTVGGDCDCADDACGRASVRKALLFSDVMSDAEHLEKTHSNDKQ